MQNEGQQMKIRLPRDLAEWIGRESSRNKSNRNSEVVRAVRERKERVEAGNTNSN